MRTLIDILSYAVLIGFDFAALCRMTKVGRGWPLQLLGLVTLVTVNVAVELAWRAWPDAMSVERWLTLLFVLRVGAVAAFVLLLSRESVGRRIFLAITYLAYATGCTVICAALSCRAVDGADGCGLFGLSYEVANLVGIGIVSALNLVFLFWVLPLLPRDGRTVGWDAPSLNAAMIFAMLFVSGVWPVSICIAPIRYCLPFALAVVAAWVWFPFLCRAMREHFHNAEIRHSLELMTNEVRARRAAIEEARRMNHDRRHDRIVITDLLLRGNVAKALEYLRETGGGGERLSASTRVWCEHETLNAILAGEARKAESKGVEFRAEAHVGKSLPLSDVELVAVVANLVENAINAGERVSVTLRQRGEMFGLTVVNPVAADFRLSPAGLPCDEPGIGLGSVREVVERHHGEWLYTVENGSLVCELAVGAGGEA